MGWAKIGGSDQRPLAAYLNHRHIRLVDVRTADLPNGGRFCRSPYSPSQIIVAIRELTDYV
jgi:hypothetical protein